MLVKIRAARHRSPIRMALTTLAAKIPTPKSTAANKMVQRIASSTSFSAERIQLLWVTLLDRTAAPVRSPR